MADDTFDKEAAGERIAETIRYVRREIVDYNDRLRPADAADYRKQRLDIEKHLKIANERLWA